jgi:hypothetical protein
MSKRYGTLIERFWAKVAVSDGCWNWTGGTRGGYGRFRDSVGKISAHRFSYWLHRGPIPQDVIVRHKCDNRACVNPDHLELGSLADNVADMDERRRRSVGGSHFGAKLTEADIPLIRADQRSHRDIGAAYGVSKTTITRIKSGAKWRHVESNNMTQT